MVKKNMENVRVILSKFILEYGDKEPSSSPYHCWKIKNRYLGSNKIIRYNINSENIKIVKGNDVNYITRNIQNEELLNEKKNFFKNFEKKPPNIVIHMLDSVSRHHIFKSLRKTAKYLHELDGDKFKVFQFLRQSAVGRQTIRNVPQMFGGFVK
jgi:hypothetical protein